MTEKFQILTFPSNVRTRPGMFLGSVEDSSEMLKEAVDNALDEVTKKRVSKIRIFINEKDKSYIVSDNSIQGFSMDLASSGQTIPDAAMSNMNAGTKFLNTEIGGRGLHGCGLKAICALTTKSLLCINISNRKLKKNKLPKSIGWKYDYQKYYLLEYKEGIKVREEFVNDFPKEFPEELKDYSTSIYYIPDLTILGDWTSRLPRTMDYTYAINKLSNDKKKVDLDIKINGKDFEPNFEDYKYQYNVDIPGQPDGKNPLVRMLGSFDLSQDLFEQQISGSVNSLHVPNGVHIRFFNEAYQNAFREVFGDCQGNELMGLNRLNIVMVAECVFDSQNKTRLSKIVDFNIKDTTKLKDALKKIMKENYEEFQQHYAKIINFLSKKVSLNEKQKITNILGDVEDNSEASRRRSLSFVPSNLKDCYSKDRDKCELFICEGKSASASILRYRSAATQAVLGLRGVPKNCTGSKIEDILEQNKEMRDLALGLGSGVDKVKNLSKCRYGKIIIAKDSDEDGERICSIILSFFSAHMKYLIEDGRIFVAVTPFYIQENKKCIYMGINDKEFNPKKSFKRIKGLGSLDKWTKQTLLDDKTRVLVQITPENMEDAVTLVRDSAPKKELVLTSGSLSMEVLK